MKLDVAIRELMEPMTLITSIDGGVRVSTHCLYPSNGTVSVSVRIHIGIYVVSDDGGAIEEAVSSGLQISNIDKRLKRFVKDQGLFVKHGVISSPRLPMEALPAAILLVANASKDAAVWTLDRESLRGGGVRRGKSQTRSSQRNVGKRTPPTASPAI